MPRGGGSGYEIKVDVREWMAAAEKTGIQAKLMQPAATEATRIGARRLASRAKTAVMATPGSGGGGPHSGLRGRIRDGIEVTPLPRGAEIRATAFLSYQYNSTWRHPVYGHDVWVSQVGTPYWDDTIGMADSIVMPGFAATILGILRF
jgi:hypothetical protein